MGLVNVLKDERDKPNIVITHEDRRNPNVLYGHMGYDPKIKVVKVGISLPRPQNYITIFDGKKEYQQEANSPVRNYYKRIIGTLGGIDQNLSPSFELMKQDGSLYITASRYGFQSGGSTYIRDVETLSTQGYCSAANLDTNGIALGTNVGNTAWDIDNYTLDTLISQGTGAGKLVYSVTPPPIVSYSSGVWTVLGRRLFDNFNADANTIIVKEVVQFAPLWNFASVTFVYIDERTVLGTPKSIPYKSGALFTYTRTLTIPDATTPLLPNGVAWLLGYAFGVNNFDSAEVWGVGHRSIKTLGESVLYGSFLYGMITSSANYTYGVNASQYSWGCCAGYGNTAVQATDYKLENVFTHGSGINQLSYPLQNIPTVVYDAGSKTYTVEQSRTLTNNYAGSQDIKELGIGIRLYYDTSGSAQGFLISRTVLGSPVTLAQTESLAIIYNFNAVHP